MAMIECAVCHRRIEAREAAYCRQCSAPMCPECEQLGQGCCTDCREDTE